MDAAQLGGQVDLTAYAKTAEVDEKLKTKVDTASLGALATKDKIETDDIVNGAVTADKIANDAITTDKVANGSITDVKLAEPVKTKLDNAVTTEGAKPDTYQILGVYNGEKVWLDIE